MAEQVRMVPMTYGAQICMHARCFASAHNVSFEEAMTFIAAREKLMMRGFWEEDPRVYWKQFFEHRRQRAADQV
jgi:hypothetical protein